MENVSTQYLTRKLSAAIAEFGYRENLPSKSELALQWPVFKPRGWGKPSRNRALPEPWFGLDTERDAKLGKFVCGWAVGKMEIQFKKFTELPDGTYWIWNLGYDIEGMIRDLNIPEAWAARQDGAPFPLLGGSARYYHGKRFDWETDSKKLSFIEASSFFGRCALSKVGKKYGQKEGVDASKMSYAQYSTDKEYREKVDSYCRQDARIVFNAVNDLAVGVNKLGVELGSTPGATARRFLSRLGQFPDILWETHKHFLRSYCGGRFEITKRGIIDMPVYQYDLVSAYPWALAQCPWLTPSAYQRWGRRFSENALYGTYRISFSFDDYLGIAPRWRNGIRVYSKAQEDTWLARPEVEWLIRNGARVEIHRGLEVFDPNASDLWYRVIKELFALKVAGKDLPEGMGAKIILNSQYGVLIQLVRRSGEWVLLNEAKNPVDFAGTLALDAPPKEFEGGKYYAPLYSGHLTALTRVRLLDAGRAVGAEAYIGGHTDSVLSTKPLPPKFISEDLGGWKLEKQAPRAEVCKTGMYAIGDTVKVRGITRKGTAALLWESLHERKSRCGIKSANNWDEVSLIRPKKVHNNFEVENKRIWERDLSLEILKRNEFVDSEALANV